MERIDAMYAYVAEEAEGREGIIAARLGGTWMPLVGATMSNAERVRPLAEEVARQKGIPVRLIKFTTREEVEVLNP